MTIRDGDERFRAMVPEGTETHLLYDRCTFAEGPVWFSDFDCLIWSDIPNNRLLRWTPDGHVSVFRSPSNHANGNTRDREGRLVSCEHSGRRVTRTEPNGRITVIADSHDGKKLNSPNDVVVKSDGSVWFTDPDYGFRTNVTEGEIEQKGDYVYRVDPSGSISVVVDDFVKPNGLVFSPDEKTLYIADSAVTDGPQFPSHIRKFEVQDDGTLKGGGVFVTTIGIPDGLRVDTAGNVWTSAGPGVNCYTASGDLLGRIDFPGDVTNLTFGGLQRTRVFVTCQSRLFAFTVNATGAQAP